MMAQRGIRQIRAALDVVRESEALRLRLMISIRSGSSEYDLINSGLENYLDATKAKFQIWLVAAYIKIAFVSLSKITMTLLCAKWSRIKRSKSVN